MKIKQNLGKLVAQNEVLEKTLRWKIPKQGKNGKFYEYHIMFMDPQGSHQIIIVKDYLNEREKGKYSVITDNEYNTQSPSEVINFINSFYFSKCKEYLKNESSRNNKEG